MKRLFLLLLLSMSYCFADNPYETDSAYEFFDSLASYSVVAGGGDGVPFLFWMRDAFAKGYQGPRIPGKVVGVLEKCFTPGNAINAKDLDLFARLGDDHFHTDVMMPIGQAYVPMYAWYRAVQFVVRPNLQVQGLGDFGIALPTKIADHQGYALPELQKWFLGKKFWLALWVMLLHDIVRVIDSSNSIVKKIDALETLLQRHPWKVATGNGALPAVINQNPATTRFRSKVIAVLHQGYEWLLQHRFDSQETTQLTVVVQQMNAALFAKDSKLVDLLAELAVYHSFNVSQDAGQDILLSWLTSKKCHVVRSGGKIKAVEGGAISDPMRQWIRTVLAIPADAEDDAIIADEEEGMLGSDKENSWFGRCKDWCQQSVTWVKKTWKTTLGSKQYRQHLTRSINRWWRSLTGQRPADDDELPSHLTHKPGS